ncbi:helix-turn-helix domain-containing protein [Enterococcus casseliflavus]|uniref:CdaR family transcriptional regulator n=1 Tax=Enterococcus casseliflavus TaxID=37734 RepID=UPI001917AF38|nr:sugar diacid recognition domain-containing protein [Enterococcus casseliflavus]QQU18263.1 helix-turn-helix domain-containing protein [Enterococcus casseliflavus]
MELEPKVAKLIVKSLKDIINHEINLFDTSGTIIASTDTVRIGTSHEGARLAAKNQQTLTIEHDNQFKGAKKGINIPVLFNQSVVAIIGITGERTKVEPLGNIIKKMTEILIRENWIQLTNFHQRQNYHNLATMLIAPQRDDSLAAYLASLLDIDLERPRILVIGKFLFTREKNNLNYEKLLHTIQSHLHIFPGSFFSLINQKSATISSYQKMDYGLLFVGISTEDNKQLQKKVLGSLTVEEIEQFQLIFETYKRYNGSIMKCAEALFLHKNTFQNKLNRITEKTGYNPRNLSDFTVLSAAFMSYRLSNLER